MADSPRLSSNCILNPPPATSPWFLHAPGMYTFPFEFNLPENVPASVEWREGKHSKATSESGFEAGEGKWVILLNV